MIEEVWIYPRNNINRCPVRLTQKYLSLCPNYKRKSNFYLQSLQKPTPIQWYGEQVVGQNTLSKVIKKLMEEAGIEGFYTNHSARYTGGMRLFRAGVQRKLVKETTGHRSDVVDKYQITSDAQREQMSEIMCNDVENNVKEVRDTSVVEQNVKETTENKAKVSKVNLSNGVSNSEVDVDSENIGVLITKLLENAKKAGKNTIKIQIEIHNE